MRGQKNNELQLIDSPHILAVNPWIHDFAAYDFWSKPYGLLSLAAILRQHGSRVSYIDCLDRFHPRSTPSDPGARFGRGPFHKTPIPKPSRLRDIPRTFSRYGIVPDWFESDLKSIQPPDLILVTGLMTYWYTGLQETVAAIRRVWSGIPIVVGGIYATLCENHARATIDADAIVTGPAEGAILDIVHQYTGYNPEAAFDPELPDTYPYPAFDLQHRINYIPLLTSRGCPFRCSYCASGVLNPKFTRRSPPLVVEEILFWHNQHGVRDFVFYDDALLVNAGRHIVPILQTLIGLQLPIRFHTPNALHIRNIDDLTAGLMYRAGFKTIRLGLETAMFDERSDMDAKVTAEEFERAVICLHQAGFKPEQIGAYLLTGLPGQSLDAVKTSIKIVKRNGITPIAAHYSPIPGSSLWPAAVAASRYDLTADPIYTNNAIQPCRRQGFEWQTLTQIKQLIET
jgi:radical SAM superfamily enzyme YgiQ (UPF0313 family)